MMKTGKLHLLQMCSSLLATTVYSVVIVTQVPLDFDYLVPFSRRIFCFFRRFLPCFGGCLQAGKEICRKAFVDRGNHDIHGIVLRAARDECHAV